MGTDEWQALASVLAEPAPCVMCAETPWTKCHRRFIADLLVARGHEALHCHPTASAHRLAEEAEVRGGCLYLCGELVA